MAEFDLQIATQKLTIDYDPIPIADGDANAIPCLVSKQTVGQYTTASTNWVYSSQIAGLPWLAAVDLGAIGTKWLVRYHASYGGSQQPFSTTIPHIELVSHRAAPIPTGYAGGEASGIGNKSPEAARDNNIAGWFVFTADGYDLEFRMEATSGLPTYYDGLELIAIPYSTTQDQRKLVEGIDIIGSQGVPAATPILTQNPYATVWEHSQYVPSTGDWLVVASCHCKTTATNVIQARFLLDGVPQKTPIIRYSSDNRDITSFVYERVHSLGAGNHTFTIEGGNAGGVADKKFWEARIYAICLNNFERTVFLKSDSAVTLTSNQQYPTWTGATMQNGLTPFSVGGEFILCVGNVIATRTTQAGVMSRLYNQTFSTVMQEYLSYAQVRPVVSGNPPPDVMSMSNVGCELTTAAANYQLQHVGQNGASASDVTLSYRDFVLIGLYKKAAPVAGVSLVAIDSAGTNESLPFGPLGVYDNAHAAESTSLISDAPPAGIANMHPRLWLNQTVMSGAQPMTRLRFLRAQAGYDDNGNQINPPGSAFWQDLLVAPNQQYALWQYALRYKITQNPAHLTAALSKISTAGGMVCDQFLSTYESDGLRMGIMVRQACYFYDWLYDDLTTAQKTMLRDYILGVAYAALKEDWAIWKPNNPDWGRNNPYNNYFMSWHEIGVYCALTLYHDMFGPTNPIPPTFAWPPGSGQNIYQWVLPLRKGQTSGPTYTDGFAYIVDRLDQIALPAWTQPDGPGSIVGGGWHEGSWYRPMWITYETFRVMMEVAGWTHASLSNVNFRDYGYYMFHSTMPNSLRAPEYGDSGSAQSRKEIQGNDRCLMLYLAEKFKGEQFGRFAQYWLNHVCTSTRPLGSTDHQYDGADFMFHNPTSEEEDYGLSISKFYFSASNQTMFSRNAWSNSAHSVLFHSHDRLQDHEHGQNNDIMIWSGLGGSNWDDRWLVGARCAHGPSGANQFEDWRAREHSTHNIGGCEQRYSGENLYPNDTLPSGHMDRRSGVDGLYVYSQGNAADAYRIGITSPSTTQPPDRGVCTTFLREYMHLPGPGVLFLYDRVVLRQNTPGGEAVPQTDVAHFHWTKPAPVDSGGVVTLTVGTAKCYQRFINPTAGQSHSFIDEGSEGANFTCVDQAVDVPVVNNYARLFTAFEMESTASPGMSPITGTTLSSEMETATLDKGGVRHHVSFAKNHTGAEPANPFVILVQKASDNDIHIIANLAIGQRYFVAESTTGGTQYTYTVTKAAAGFLSDAAGVLTFLPTQLASQTNSVISRVDAFTTTREYTDFVKSEFSTATDSAATAEATAMQTSGSSILVVNDNAHTSDVPTMVGPLLGFDSCGTSEDASFITDIEAPDNSWHEKIIDAGTGPIVPASDFSSNFFLADPNDGALFDKLADDNDSTFVFTAGPTAGLATLTFRLTDIPTYIGRITQFQYLMRIVYADQGASLGVRVNLAIDGLGLTVLAQTLRAIPFTSTLAPVEYISIPVTCNITRAQMSDARLTLNMSGFNFGSTFQVRISKLAIIPLVTSPSEKGIQ